MHPVVASVIELTEGAGTYTIATADYLLRYECRS